MEIYPERNDILIPHRRQDRVYRASVYMWATKKQPSKTVEQSIPTKLKGKNADGTRGENVTPDI